MTYESDNPTASANASSTRQIGQEMDPDLTAVIGAWASLPDAVKAGIVAMVRASAL